MSLVTGVPHPYQPTPNIASSSQTAILRINKRITAKPTPFTPPTPPTHQPSQTEESPACGPFIVRLALKTTYNISVPHYMTRHPASETQPPPAKLSALELTERGKQVVKHAEVLRSQTGRMVLRVGCVVDGEKIEVRAVQEAFVAGIRRVS